MPRRSFQGLCASTMMAVDAGRKFAPYLLDREPSLWVAAQILTPAYRGCSQKISIRILSRSTPFAVREQFTVHTAYSAIPRPVARRCIMVCHALQTCVLSRE